MKLRFTPLILLAASMLTMASAFAQEDAAVEAEQPTAEERRANREELRERWKGMSDEERQAAREQHRSKSDERRQAMRERRDNMSDEERQAMRERWENMSDEERQAMREKRKLHRDGKGKGQGRGPGHRQGPKAENPEDA